jgi:hypothetical protein
LPRLKGVNGLRADGELNKVDMPAHAIYSIAPPADFN